MEVIVSEMCLNEPYRFLKWAQEQFRRRIYLSKRGRSKNAWDMSGTLTAGSKGKEEKHLQFD